MSTKMSWRICAALLFCVLFSGEVLAQTPVRVCTTCTNASHLYADAYAWANANASIYINTSFLSTTPAPYTYRQCYLKGYTYQVPQGYVITVNPVAMSSCPNPGAPIGPPVLPPPVIQPWMVDSNDYYTRAGDYNGDGLNDLYVTGHPTRRFVQDFIVFNLGSSYTVNANPTAAQRAQAASMPLTGAKVVRVDGNADGLYDFIISDTNVAIPGHAADIIVLTNKGGGSVPTRALAYTQQMKDSALKVAEVLQNPALHLARAQTTYCHRIDYAYHTFYRSIYLGGDTIYSGEIPSTTADRQLAEWLRLQGSAVYHPDIVVHCFNGMSNYSQAAQQLLQRMDDVVKGPDANMILQAILSAQWNAAMVGRGLNCENNGVLANTGAVAGVAAVVALMIVILQASSDTDPDVVQRAMTELGRLLGGCIVTVPVPADTGPMTADNAQDVGPDTRRNVSVDVIYRFAECQNPEGGNQLPTVPGTVVGNSGRLRDNLNKANCACPQGDSNQPHHMVGLKDSAAATRNILTSCGIDLDHASNGVCLPTKSHPGAGRTVTHNETYGGKYSAAVDSRIGTAYGSGQNCDRVKEALRDIRRSLANGDRFWLP